MDRDTAEEIMEALAWMEFPIDKLAIHIKQNVSEEVEREKLFSALKELFSGHFDIQHLILRDYPDLDPIGKGADWYFALKEKYQTEEYPAKRLSAEQIRSAKSAGKRAASEIQSETDANNNESSNDN